MLESFPELYQGREEIRMMYRSTHIYLLLASLINILAANAVGNLESRVASRIEFIASIFLVVSQIVLFMGFVCEPPTYLINRPFSFFGIIFLVVGVILGSLARTKWIFRRAT